MGNVAISVEGLGKRYRIGSGPKEPYGSLRESMVRAAQAPLRRLRGSERRPDAKDIWALRDVSFEVKHGEAVGIIGRNGAGKSTLLKLLSRITEPTAGRAVVHGRVGSLLEVGTGFHPELTGRENIYLNGAVMGMSRAEIKRHFDEIVDFSGVEQFLDTPVKRYSSGMYMRLAFAVAAHLEPEVLVVDEVLAVGDAEFQKKCLGKMSQVANEGRTVLFVSHSLSAVTDLCRRSILLQDGGFEADGPTGNIVRRYASSLAETNNATIDLTDPRLRQNSLAESKFRWTRMSIRNMNGDPLSLIGFQEAFQIVLEATIVEQLTNLHAGFTVRSSLGFPVFSSYIFDDSQPTTLPPGSVRFHVRFNDNLLAPGVYGIGLGANGPGVIDWIPSAGYLSISEAGTCADAKWETFRSGVLRYPCTWSYEYAHMKGDPR